MLGNRQGLEGEDTGWGEEARQQEQWKEGRTDYSAGVGQPCLHSQWHVIIHDVCMFCAFDFGTHATIGWLDIGTSNS